MENISQMINLSEDGDMLLADITERERWDYLNQIKFLVMEGQFRYLAHVLDHSANHKNFDEDDLQRAILKAIRIV